MPRVVITKNGEDLVEAASACPVNCFHKDPESGTMVIDPDACIDCGICQMQAPEGAILEDSEASEEAKKFNEEKAKDWPEAN